MAGVSVRKSSGNRKELTGVEALSQASKEEEEEKRSEPRFAEDGVLELRAEGEEGRGWQRRGAAETAEVCRRPQPRSCPDVVGGTAAAAPAAAAVAGGGEGPSGGWGRGGQEVAKAQKAVALRRAEQGASFCHPPPPLRLAASAV